tara:strand:+ start:640 stop:1032 length:393 start_codon:yes stop_codon:yes gene_type:complete
MNDKNFTWDVTPAEAEDYKFEHDGITITINTDAKPRMAPITHQYQIGGMSTTNNTQGAGLGQYTYDTNGQIKEFGKAKAADDWPNESVIEEMIKKYPGLKIQYDKFMTVYNLVKDDYTYEEHYEKVDGSI